MDDDNNSGNSQPTPRPVEHQRAYKACISCRKRKAKCDLAGRDGPPCARCRRELRECVFSAERTAPKRRRVDDDDDERSSPRGSSSRDNPAVYGPLSGDIAAQARAQETPPGQTQHVAGTHRSPPTWADGSSFRAREEGFPDLARSVMTTVVSNGNDALNLLFQAATGAHEDCTTPAEPQQQVNPGSDSGLGSGSRVRVDSQSLPTPSLSEDVVKLWKSSKFVRMGWLSPQECITYLDLFYKNMAPLSPVLTNHYKCHVNHHELLTKDPLLCCTILMISSRYHVLPGAGGASRSYFIHDKSWRHCQHLITRLLFGQEKGPHSRLRTLGTIEALLLLSEWHSRSLHFPPEVDGWDADLLVPDEDDSPSTRTPPNRWLEDVIEPARRSDRMSWMLLGCAQSLFQELNAHSDDEQSLDWALNSTSTRTTRVKRLLHVFTHQLAARLGTTSTLPQSMTNVAMSPKAVREQPASEYFWGLFMNGWSELTKILKLLSEMVFQSKSLVQDLIKHGNYVSLLKHFRSLLGKWEEDYLTMGNPLMPLPLQDTLFIEYQYIRIYCNSLGMQAICERAFTVQTTTATTGATDSIALTRDAIDQASIDEVIAGSLATLEKAISLANNNTLRYSPVRVFLRITTSSVFLLKALSIGVRNVQLLSALSVLHRTVTALRENVLDDMHLANSYANLLDIHIRRLQQGFLVSSQRMPLPTVQATTAGSPAAAEDGARLHVHAPAPEASIADIAAMDADVLLRRSTRLGGDWDEFTSTLDRTSAADDWLSLPFDPAMAPFGLDYAGMMNPVGLDGDGLNFIWNLPVE